MRTKKQKAAAQRAWNILRLRGAIHTLEQLGAKGYYLDSVKVQAETFIEAMYQKARQP